MMLDIREAATEQQEHDRAQLQLAAAKMLQVLPRMFKQMWNECRDSMPADMNEIGHTQLGLYHALSHDDCTITELARRMHVTAPTISRMVDTLVSKALAERRQDPGDRRITWISLTPRGQALNSEIEGSVRNAAARFMGPLSDEQLRTVLAALEALQSLLRQDQDAHNTD